MVVLALAILIPPTGTREVSFYYSSERDNYLGPCEFVVRPSGGAKKFQITFYDRAGTPRKPLAGATPIDIQHTKKYRFKLSRGSALEHKYMYGADHEIDLATSVKTPKAVSVRNRRELELIGSRKGAKKAIKIERDINKGRVTLTWPGAREHWVIDYKNMSRERFGPAPEKEEGAGGEEGKKDEAAAADTSGGAGVKVMLEGEKAADVKAKTKVLSLVKGEKISSGSTISFTVIDEKLAGTKFLQLPAKTAVPYGISVTDEGKLWLLVHRGMKTKGLRGWRKTDLKVITGMGSLVVLQMDVVAGGGYKVLGDKRLSPIVVASKITLP
jgi:hypothetical protein